MSLPSSQENNFWTELLESNQAPGKAYLVFRHEYGRLVSLLTKIFGTHNLELAEDAVQDTLLKAMQHWKFHGMPQNPAAWLLTAARNKVIDVIRKEQKGKQYEKNITPLLQSEYSLAPAINRLLNNNDIEDDQLRMMFVCCHPAVQSEGQVALILKTLCGFSVQEIARAFISNYDTIEKRLYRARQQFRIHKINFELPPADELETRLDNVLTAVYLLFNEGYNATTDPQLVRSSLMFEAIRLCDLLLHNPLIAAQKVKALQALMYFTAARNNARTDTENNILLLQQQDRTLWNKSMINKGVELLTEASDGISISKYHLEAAIAAEHAYAKNYQQTNWKNIISFYNMLYQLQPSPVIALNRIIVISELYGPQQALQQLNDIKQLHTLKNFYLLYAVLGDLHVRLNEKEKACDYFKQALELTESQTEKKLLQQKMKTAATEE